MSYSLRAVQVALLAVAGAGAWSHWGAAAPPAVPGDLAAGESAGAGHDVHVPSLAAPGRRVAIAPPAPARALTVAAVIDERPRGLGALPPVTTGPIVEPPTDLAGERDAWTRGKELFEREWTAATGLGAPHFNEESCVECHRDPVAGGAGGVEFNVVQETGARSSKGAGAVQRYLRGRKSGRKLDERTRRILAKRMRQHGGVRRADRAEPRPGEGIQTPSLLGLGVIDAIPDEEIERNADPTDVDQDGIAGEVRRVRVPAAGVHALEAGERTEVGRFGWTAEVPRLADFVCMALAGETGITAPDQGRGFGMPFDLDEVSDPEVDQRGLDDLVLFVASLPPPERAGRAHTAEVLTGERLFGSIGCTKCHVPSLRGGDGAPVPLYSDLLLHRATSDDDAGPRKKAKALQLRTPPLWGVRDTAPYLHDGRAATLRLAILAHDHEAAPARTRFEELLEYDQEALLAFLEDL